MPRQIGQPQVVQHGTTEVIPDRTPLGNAVEYSRTGRYIPRFIKTRYGLAQVIRTPLYTVGMVGILAAVTGMVHTTDDEAYNRIASQNGVAVPYNGASVEQFAGQAAEGVSVWWNTGVGALGAFCRGINACDEATERVKAGVDAGLTEYRSGTGEQQSGGTVVTVPVAGGAPAPTPAANEGFNATNSFRGTHIFENVGTVVCPEDQAILTITGGSPANAIGTSAMFEEELSWEVRTKMGEAALSAGIIQQVGGDMTNGFQYSGFVQGPCTFESEG